MRSKKTYVRPSTRLEFPPRRLDAQKWSCKETKTVVLQRIRRWNLRKGHATKPPRLLLGRWPNVLVERPGSLQACSALPSFRMLRFSRLRPRYFHGTRQEYTVSAGMILRSTFVVQTVVTFLLRSEGSEGQQDRLAGQFTQRCSLTELAL